jgi:holo-ACP synthase/triphosphoribosyl-dephospho-CoA synthase
LEARDQRAFLKTQIAQRGLPCLSLSLNVPGFPKSNPTVKTFFDYCLREFKYSLKADLVNIIKAEAIEQSDAAGDFYLVPCSLGILTLPEIKQVCEAFEQNHPLGRFIDADLNDQNGETVSSGRSKLCFFCLERPAIECRRENAHEPEELRSFMFPKMAEYCRQKLEEEIIIKLSSLAQQAILSEISLTPKPGLVDKISNGSHADMNYQTFIDSTAAISPWFSDLAREGFSFRNSDLAKALPKIRNIGLRMESAMFAATQNTNTQKGVIFLMGLSLFTCGKLFSQSDQFSTETFRAIIQGICKDLVKKEFVPNSGSGKSHGEEIFLKYGSGGARGEAENGFRMVFEFGLPQLTALTQLNDESLIKCFLAIAANNNDTNILYRSNPQVLSDFKKHCKNALENFSDENYAEVIDYCKNKNISPGGSADLLAVTIFVWSVMRQFDNSTM